MRKLSDVQLTTLSRAAARDDGAAVKTETVTNAAATKRGASLVAGKLMREIRSKSGMPVWRKDRDGRTLSLVITAAGREAIGVVDEGRDSDRMDPTDQVSVVVRSDGAGNGAHGGSAKKAERKAAGARSRMMPEKSDDSGAAAIDAGGSKAAGAASVPSPRSGSKQSLVLEMLAQPDGATLKALVAATGWLPHTTRAALTGLRKRGYAIERAHDGNGGASIYRVTQSIQPAA
jgi:hypothetical protein